MNSASGGRESIQPVFQRAAFSKRGSGPFSQIPTDSKKSKCVVEVEVGMANKKQGVGRGHKSSHCESRLWRDEAIL